MQGDSEVEDTDRPTTREYIDIKFEIPTWREITGDTPKKTEPVKKKTSKKVSYEAGRTADRSSGGNRGYLMSGNEAEEETSYYSKRKREPVLSKRIEPEIYEYEKEVEIEEVVFEEPASEPTYTDYTVKEGDTLSHIAKRFYDKASKWTVIYEANSDKIKDPARIKPGMVLMIPDLSEAEAEYVK